MIKRLLIVIACIVIPFIVGRVVKYFYADGNAFELWCAGVTVIVVLIGLILIVRWIITGEHSI